MPSNPSPSEISKENIEINPSSNETKEFNEIVSVSTEKKIKSRSEKKEEGRRRKRKLIEEAGGVRPRPKNKHESENESTTKKKKKKKKKKKTASTTSKTTYFVKGAGGKVQVEQPNDNNDRKANEDRNRHRFGRVMEQAPCTNQSRYSTLSIAVPGSVVANCQTRELKTAVVGQIARAVAIYHVDEIIVFDDQLSSEKHNQGNFSYDRRNRRNSERNSGNSDKNRESKTDQDAPEPVRKKSDPHAFMARILQYCECPQYLRRSFFPMHPDLQFAGLLHPLDAPHHVRSGERSKYREGVVLDKVSPKSGNSLVNVGIFKTPVEIDLKLKPGIRCTVELDVKTAYQNDSNSKPKQQFVEGKVVSPNAPKQDNGTYWGYTTRLASNLKAVFDECPYEGSYDLKIGTSERGDVTVDDVNPSFQIPHFKHALIVFGGVAGIEECVDADETMTLSGKNSKQLFDIWVNTCPFQGSRTIRTEEAVLLSLARLRPLILRNDESKVVDIDGENDVDMNSATDVGNDITVDREFSDEAISDESSGDE